MNKVDKGLIKDSPTKDPLVLKGSTRLGFPTLNLKEVIVVVRMFLVLIVQNVVETIKANTVGSDWYQRCGKSGHTMIYYPMIKVKGRKDKKAPPSNSNSNSQKQNNFYALQSRGN